MVYQVRKRNQTAKLRNAIGIADHRAGTQPALPSQMRPDLPSHLDDVIMALLSDDPLDRPGSALELQGDLAQYVHTARSLSMDSSDSGGTRDSDASRDSSTSRDSSQSYDSGDSRD